MEGSSSKGSSKRKPAFTMKIKVSGKKKHESDSDNDDYDSDYSKRKSRSKRDNSDISDAESIPDLPEGTIVVKPEPVKEKKIRFSGPEFSRVPDNLDIVNCTSCGRQINPNVSGAAKRHPELKVLICRKCYSYYRSGKIEQDEDGLDEQCRWCGEGGRLLGCDHCHNAFCKSCIIRNFSRAELTTVMADDGSKWKCYVCDPSKLKKLLRECDSLFKKIEKEKLKAKMQSSTDSKKSNSSKPQKATGKSMTSKEHVTSKTHKDLVSIANFTVGTSNVVNLSTQLLGLTAGFHTMLEVLNVDLNTSGDVKNSSREANSKKDHGAQTLDTGLKEFLKSVNTILCDALESKEKAPVENGETTEDESVVSNGHISLSDDDNSAAQTEEEVKVSRKSAREGRQVKKGSKTEEKAPIKNRDWKKDVSRSSLRKESKMDVSVDDDVSNEVCDVDNDSDEFDVPVSFGPTDGAGDAHTVSKDEQTESKSDESESQTKDDNDGVKGSRPLSETENEAAQLELLKELAEEMCKEQKERKEEKINGEESSKVKVPEKKKRELEDKNEVTKEDIKDKNGDVKDKSGDSSKSAEDSSVDDSVSSSDLLMSSDSDFAQSWSMKKKKEKGQRKSGRTEDKLERKKRKKQKKEKAERRSSRKRKEEKKLRKWKPKATDSEDDLEKEISKLEEEPEMKKKSKKEKTDSEEDLDEATACKKEKKKEVSEEEKKGRKTRGKKKTETSSSDDGDDDNEVDDEDDDDDEDEDDVLKMKNGKSRTPESANGKDLENEVAKKALMAELEDADEEGGDESGNDDSESDDDAKKKKKGAKKEKKPVKEENDDSENDSENEDSDAVPSTRKRIRSKLLDAKLSGSDSGKDRKSKKKKQKSEESDSEEIVVKKKSKKKKSSDEDYSSDSSSGKKKKGKRKKKQQKKKKRGKKRKLTSDSESGDSSSSSSASDSDSEISLDTEEEERREKLKAERKARRKAKGNKRRRIKEQKDSSDEKGRIETDSDIDGSDDDDDDDDDDGKSPDKSGRKNIRKIKSDKKLTDDTKRARKAEECRRKRVAERQKEFNHVVQITDDTTKCPITTQLILEMDKEKKEPIIQVNKKLVRKLKPHQVEATQFMWDCLCETSDRIKKKEGSGCILAHCMGLGKTLSVISFVHTMLSNEKCTSMRTCLIVCPLNTVINWSNEWVMWFDEKDQLDVYEISSVKQNWPRADYLKDWHEGGGIMIMGYEMYRNLTQSARIKNKKLKAIFQKTLVDPGPDLVVCDEGHILKNDSSAISQALNKVRTRRRVVLTGTPLQNNLLEYHCMASFVKPNLMGTRKEFLNRFVNPITNGQHSDSTAFDVKVMGRRAHVLHEMLAGCVQRRDYSALTKFLPPKFEYVISVRLSPVQIDLYEKYLELAGIGVDGGPPTINRGARLFSDYQNLMKIWTHPWVLKLAEIRADNRMKYDDSEDSFIDNSTDEEMASMTDNSDDSVMNVSKSDSGESVEAGPSNRASRRSRRGKPPPEDSDKEEVVKDWKTRSRGGEDDGIEIDDGPKPVSSEWWAEYVKEEDQSNLDLSGKLLLLFEILRMCEEIGDKVLVFSQSLLSLDIIEYFLDLIDKKAEEAAMQKEEERLMKEKEKEEKEKEEKGKEKDGKEEKDQNGEAKDGEKKEDGEKKDGEKEDDSEEFVQTVFGKSWTKGADYFRMDGSTSPQLRSQWSDHFNDPENFRARLFLISTKAGSLGINLVAANRVIIFDASWNPSHDIQSIFRVYRFGQTKPCYVYRFLAQGTMEEKIYERQVTKQSLSQRVVDEHQIDRHFTSADLSELYHFKPERLDDPNQPKTIHALPKDVLLAELLKQDKQIVKFHEHDSLLENRADQTLTEEEKKAAWEEYDNERKGMTNRVAQASTASGVGMFSPDNVLQIVQMVKMRFPNLPPDLFQAQVQAILQQQILYQQTMQNQQIERQRLMEMHRLQSIQNDIRSQQRQIQVLNRNRLAYPRVGGAMGPRMGMSSGTQPRIPNQAGALRSILTTPGSSTGKKDASHSRSSTPNNPPVVIDLSKS